MREQIVCRRHRVSVVFWFLTVTTRTATSSDRGTRWLSRSDSKLTR
jgi:hypothetical protein